MLTLFNSYSIPRTPQMALTGIKDLSMIESAPLNRYLFKHTSLKDMILLLKKLLENCRGGQVFIYIIVLSMG